ncbi:hypothetical protein VTJ49DRAFT_1113 [Mycothermus thermophilus]|uniref:Uncharacterized protein n=1 Tax=Humicola insolens TaxID=85995 RepID=A0ABR3VPX8_HUMIN
MGLPLRDPASFSSFNSGPSYLGRHCTAQDADPALGAADRSDDRNRKLSRHRYREDSKHKHRDCAPGSCRLGRGYQCYRVLASRKPRTHTSRARQVHHRLEARLAPLAAETHHVKPYSPWAADADEGVAVARSSLRLPGETVNGTDNESHASQSDSFSQHDRRRARSRSSTSSSGSQTRPPSLERQDAFRDEKTAKRRRTAGADRAYYFDDSANSYGHFAGDDTAESDADSAETAELYRLGLLYDNDYERGAGFSLAYLDHGVPAYSLRVRQARRPRRRQQWQERQATGWSSQDGVHGGSGSDNHDETMTDRDDGQEYLVDLAFSAFGEHEAFRQWMVPDALGSGFGFSGQASQSGSRAGTRRAPLLTVVYELAEEPEPSPTTDRFFEEDVSVSDLSTCGWAEEDEMAWAVLDAVGEVKGAEKGTLVDGDEVEPWVMLSRDGS